MIKTHARSRFVLKSIDDIRDSRDIILQFEKSDSTFTGSGKTAYICEAVSPADYDRRDTAEQLAAEIRKVNEDNRSLRRKIGRLEAALQKERSLNNE